MQAFITLLAEQLAAAMGPMVVAEAVKLGPIAIEEVIKLAAMLIGFNSQPMASPETVDSFLLDCRGIITAIRTVHPDWPVADVASYSFDAIRNKAMNHNLVVSNSEINKLIGITTAALNS